MFFTRIISDGYQFESDTFQNGSDIIQQPTVISSSACVRGKSTVYVCVCVCVGLGCVRVGVEWWWWWGIVVDGEVKPPRIHTITPNDHATTQRQLRK